MNQQTVPSSTEQNRSPTQEPGSEQQHRRRRWIWVALALVVVGIVVWIVAARYSRASQANQAKARGPAITPVTAVVAHKGDIGVYLTGLGAVTPLYTVTVRTRVDGQLMKVLYKEGQTVHKGELLAVIDPRPFEVQLTQAQGQLIKDQAALENARVDLTRYQELIKRNAVAEQTLATQKALVLQDEGAVKTDQGLVASAKLNLVYSNITSPITGRVGLRLVDPGNIVHATDTNGLLVITQIEPISVIFTISEEQVPPVLERVRAGQHLPVDAYNRDLKTKLSEGALMTLDNQIDQTTGTLRLRALFNNKDDALFPNQFVNARLLVNEKHNVTLVPNTAIQRNAQTTYVYLVKPDQTVTIRPVTVGTSDADESEIVSGLSPSDVVVTTGVDKLQEGSKVNAQIGGAGSARSGS